MGAKTLAIKMGVRVINGNLNATISYKTLAYMIQIINAACVLIPLFLLKEFSTSSILRYVQLTILSIISLVMFLPTYKIFSMKRFDRSRAIRYIAIYYICNFSLVPIMLMSLNPWAGFLVFFPPLGFILSNLILHGTILQPKTM